jgi:predicted alpha/beta-hydrolase family hydrolase
MTVANPQPVTITVDDARRVSGLLQTPPEARACYVLAHGAGAGMAHPFMAAVAEGLAGRGIATLRYQFPYILGFPLHPAGLPSDDRGKHLFEVQIPMLFMQGTRDEFADLQLLRPLVGQFGARATLKLFEGADHSFHVPARTGRKGSDVRTEVLDALAGWIEKVSA